MVGVTQRNANIPNAVLGMMLFIGTEVMFFAGLISAYLVIRASETVWPPFGQPRLPVEATAFNSLVLLASGVVMYRAGKALASRIQHHKTQKLVTVSILLGAFFVMFQGYEWVRLIGFGLTATSSLYGGLFYIIIGAHAAHVGAALCFLAFVRIKASPSDKNRLDPDVFTAARMFWYFVVGVWPVLYYLVYLY